MLRKLKLYGKLAEFVGYKEFEIQASNVPKAISFLVNNFPQVESYMNPQYYQVKVGNYAIDKDEIQNPIGKEDIHIVPVISGAGRGFGKILLGAALIAGAFMFSPMTLGSFTAKGIAAGAVPFAKIGFLTKASLYLGTSLVLGGVSDMLFPMPTPTMPEDDPRISFNFSGTQNTGRAGTPVPIVYGEIITGSVVISGAIDTEQVQK
jgi:predicted phage tail protein